MNRMRGYIIWIAILSIMTIPFIFSTMSPLLQWRSSIYIIAGFLGIIGMSLMLIQPILISQYLPGLSPRSTRKIHYIIGNFIVIAVIGHVIGLWITSPPDVIDVLLLRSPTPFSIWGVIAMWLVLITGVLAVFRKKLKLKPKLWRFTHIIFVIIIVITTIIHVLLIEGTMETFTKIGLCILLLATTIKVIVDLKMKKNDLLR